MSAPIATAKSTVFVLGGSGNTGSFVVNGLLYPKIFHVIVLTRPQSENKPKIQALKQKGVEIRIGDLAKLSIAEVETLLNGVDIVLSLANVTVLEDQKKVFQAAKNVGVKRVVPSDFAIPYPPGGELQLAKQKIAMRSFIKELGINYTFIDVGWWMEMILPYPADHKGPITDLSHTFVGAGDVKTAVTCREDIGHFVALILADPRTVNSYVFCRTEEITQSEVYRIAEQVTGENFESIKIHVSANSIAEEIAKERDVIQKQGIPYNLPLIMLEYLDSLFVHGDNTLETAKKLGALDASVLYPDFKPKPVKEFAREFYKNIPEFAYEP